MLTKDTVLPRLIEIITPFNRAGTDLNAKTTFATDLELDSLTVMDLTAEIEDEYDMLIPVNMLPDLETIGDVADAVVKIKNA
ncbi:acyl carrier protein [Pacificimonas sp. WHA3]|uniref:Acyl carrier protein n=1 Tax=Pacificimonas pallii TaxID=2827236 RepID=A0ABS6SAZ2_9SPHN|nr:acyl carrier protein [Pacificimonas pallii]MBV7255579.1 acyl carrier protein [Pacificimonas pallii]